VGDEGSGTTPAALRKLYGMGNTAALSGKGVQAFASFLGDAVRASDLKQFLKSWVPAGVGTMLAKSIGPQDTSKCSDPACTEPMLDSEYLMAMGLNVTTWVWAEGGTHSSPTGGAQESFLEWVIAVGNTSTIPDVFSISYADAEYTLGSKYVTRCNTELAKLAARGVSVLAASGDYGVAGAPPVTDKCMTRFIPTWPAASPWVTAVGGTTGNGKEEGAWEHSGGGFSDVAPRPKWQDAAVTGYLNTKTKTQPLPDKKSFNATGRAYPDVSARATGFSMILQGAETSVDGTSGACPTMAGIVSLLNDARFLKGGKPLGFLNPLLYANPQALVDVPKGANGGCGIFDDTGFGAAVGFDPVTGLGYPQFKELLAVVQNSTSMTTHVH